MFNSIGRDNRILMLAMVFWALGEGLWLNLRPIYMAQLGATPSQAGLLLAIEGTARVVALIPGGLLSDRHSPRKLIRISWMMGAPAAILIALAPDWRWMIPGEALYGASFFVAPVLTSYTLLAVPRGVDDDKFERTLTTVFAAFSVGLIFSPPIGGLIADRYGIRSTYLLSAALFATSTLVIFQIRHHSVIRESVSGDWHTLLRSWPFMSLIGFFFLLALSMTFGWPLAPIFLHDVRDFPFRLIGIFASLFSVGTVAWNLTLGHVRPRWGLPVLLALVWLSMLILVKTGAAVAVAFAHLLMGAIFTLRTVMLAAVARRVSPAQRGLAFAINEVFFWSAMALSPRIAGMLYEVRPALPFIASLLSIPLAAIGSIVLLSALRRPVSEPPA